MLGQKTNKNVSYLFPKIVLIHDALCIDAWSRVIRKLKISRKEKTNNFLAFALKTFSVYFYDLKQSSTLHSFIILFHFYFTNQL